MCVKELMLTKVMVHASELFAITGTFLRCILYFSLKYMMVGMI